LSPSLMVIYFSHAASETWRRTRVSLWPTRKPNPLERLQWTNFCFDWELSPLIHQDQWMLTWLQLTPQSTKGSLYFGVSLVNKWSLICPGDWSTWKQKLCILLQISSHPNFFGLPNPPTSWLVSLMISSLFCAWRILFSLGEISHSENSKTLFVS
jgi:hypothetical protein